jgi:sodium-coupled neutral amino acid transporter 9
MADDDMHDVLIQDGDDKELSSLGEKDNSASVVFSLWSTMMGSTVLVMPKMMRDAGAYPAIPCLAGMCLLTAYTATIMTKLGRYHGNTTKQIVDTLPKPLKITTLIASACIYIGASALFNIYITASILTFLDKDMSDAKYRIIVGLSTSALVFIISMLKTLGPLFKASSFGIISVAFCLVFMVIKSIQQMSNDGCKEPLEKPFGLELVGIGPLASLMAMMTVSFLCHNFVLQMLSQSTRPAKNTRNVYAAFVFTGISYMLPSALAVIAFAKCGDFKGDFIQMFDGVYSDVARVAITALILVIYPLVIFLTRNQLLEEVYGDEGYPYPVHLLVNLVVISITTLPTLFNMPLAVVGALVGCFGTYWVLGLPPSLYIRARLQEGTATPAFLVAHGAIVTFGAALVVITVLSQAQLMPDGDKPVLKH